MRIGPSNMGLNPLRWWASVVSFKLFFQVLVTATQGSTCQSSFHTFSGGTLAAMATQLLSWASQFGSCIVCVKQWPSRHRLLAFPVSIDFISIHLWLHGQIIWEAAISCKKATNNQSLPEPPMTEVWRLHVRLPKKVTFHWRCKSPFRNKDLLNLWLEEKQDCEKHFLITAKLTNRLSLVWSFFNRMSRCVHVIACEWYRYDIYEFLKRKFFWKITIKLELRAFSP